MYNYADVQRKSRADKRMALGRNSRLSLLTFYTREEGAMGIATAVLTLSPRPLKESGTSLVAGDVELASHEPRMPNQTATSGFMRL